MSPLVSHLLGDYIFQNHWEATKKTTSWAPAVSHAVKYTAAFLPITRNPVKLGVIGGTHLILDRYRLAKHISWAKNNVGVPSEARYSWEEGKANNGYPEDVPAWMSVWLMIILDNSIHVAINDFTLNRGKHGKAQT